MGVEPFVERTGVVWRGSGPLKWMILQAKWLMGLQQLLFEGMLLSEPAAGEHCKAQAVEVYD